MMMKKVDRVSGGLGWKFWDAWMRVMVGVLMLGVTSVATAQEEPVEQEAAPVAVEEEVVVDEGPKSMDDLISSVLAGPAAAFEGIVFTSIPIPGTGEKVPFVLLWLAGAGVFLTIYFKFVNLRALRLAIRTIKGKYSSPDDPGQITHFQALSAAISATVGLGNIAG
ncbi:MAG: alanine:cation symporter family protein, partial [Verrucomicrobiales bacterium]|nr:alanine:cation symporter family protein [Verrucomicrobiales bacterium]